MKRRDFIKDSAILVAAAGAGKALKAADRSFASLRMTGAHADGLVEKNSRSALGGKAYLVGSDQGDVLRMLHERMPILPGLSLKSRQSHIIGLPDESLTGSVELGK